MIDKLFGDRLKNLRNSAKKNELYTQINASRDIGISYKSLQNHEAGRIPSKNNLRKYLDFYKCSRIWLLTGVGEPFPNKEGLPIKEAEPAYRPAQPGGQSRNPLDLAINQIKALEEAENRAGVKKLIIALADLLVDIDNDHKSMDNVNRTELLWKRLQSTEKDCASLRDEMVLLRQEIRQLRRLLPELPGAPLKKEIKDSEL